MYKKMLRSSRRPESHKEKAIREIDTIEVSKRVRLFFGIFKIFFSSPYFLCS